MKKIVSLFIALAIIMTSISPLFAEDVITFSLPSDSKGWIEEAPEIPKAEAMFMYNVKLKTVIVTVETKCKYDENTITYIIREPAKGPGDGKIIDTVNADGVYNLPTAMKQWGKFNNVNVVWTYNNGPIESGHFETPCYAPIN